MKSNLSFKLFLFLLFILHSLPSYTQNNNIEQAINQIVETYNKGHHNDAILLLNNLLKTNQKDKNLLTRIFSLLQQWNIFEAEIEILNKEKTSAPSNPFPYKILSEIYLFLQKPLDSLRELEILVTLNDKDKEALIQLGKIYKDNHWFSSALETFNKAIILEPDSQEILSLIGDTYFSDGDVKNAEIYWKKAIKFDKSNINSYVNYADILIRNGLHFEATNIYEEGRRYFNDNKQFSTQLSSLYESQMRYLESVEEYIKIGIPMIENNFDPNNWAINKIISIFKKEKEIRSNIINLLLPYKQNKNVNRLLLELYFINENYASSLKLAREISLNTKDDGEILLHFGDLLVKENKYNFAIDFFNEGLEELNLSPKSKNFEKFILKLGNAYQLNKDYENAIKTFRSITNNSNTCEVAEALMSLGSIFEELEKYDSAEENLLTIFDKYQHCPLFESSFLKLIKIYIKSGNLDKSISFIESTKKFNFSLDTVNEIEFIRGKISYFKFDFNNALASFKKITTNVQSKFINDSIYFILFIGDLVNDSDLLKDIAKVDFLIEQKKFQESKKLLFMLSEENTSKKKDDFILYKLSEIYTYEKSYDLAIKSLKEIQKISNNEELIGIVLKSLAEVYEKMNNYNEAKKIYKSIIEEYPLSFWAEYSKNKIISYE